MQNTAETEGGAIGTLAESTNTLSAIGSTFTKNVAIQGPALMAFGDMNFEYSTSTFIKNVAKYGDAVSTKPSRLRLKVYEVSELYLYQEIPDIEKMLTYPTTVINSLKFLSFI